MQPDSQVESDSKQLRLNACVQLSDFDSSASDHQDKAPVVVTTRSDNCDEWRELVDDTGVIYYDNPTRKISQYQRPDLGILGKPILSSNYFFGVTPSGTASMRMGAAMNAKMQLLLVEMPSGWEATTDKYGMTCYISDLQQKRQYTHPALNAAPFEPEFTDYVFGYPADTASRWAWLRYFWWKEIKKSHAYVSFLSAIGILTPPSDVRAQRRLVFRIFFLMTSVLCGSMNRAVFAEYYATRFVSKADQDLKNPVLACEDNISCQGFCFAANLALIIVPLNVYMLVVLRFFHTESELNRLKALNTLHLKSSKQRRFWAPVLLALLSLLILSLTVGIAALFFTSLQQGDLREALEGLATGFFFDFIFCLKPVKTVSLLLIGGDKRNIINAAKKEIHKEVGKLLCQRVIKEMMLQAPERISEGLLVQASPGQ